MKPISTFRVALFCLLLVLNGKAFGQAIEFSGTTMGPIQFRVIVDPLPDGLDKEDVAAKIKAELESVNQAMSTYIPDSDVSRFNNSGRTDWFEVTEETAFVIQNALQISENTEGAFDITVGPLVDLWHFGPDKSNRSVPSQEQIKSAKSSVGYEKLAARLEPPAIKKTDPDLKIDLSAIAKGYAVDRVAGQLESLNIENYFVVVGGEVRAGGKRSDGQLWSAALELPDKEQVGAYDRVAELSGKSLAASGDYRNFYVVDGVSYSHTIDPTTGMPVIHNLASASVIADDCMSADAYATATIVLGYSKSKALLDKLSLPYFLMQRVDTGYKVTVSDDFPVKSGIGAKAKSKTSILPMFLGAAIVFGIAVLGMACGAILNNKPITGSCGGLSAMTGGDADGSCSLCHKPTADCPDLESDTTNV